MMETKHPCIACGKDYTVKRDALHEAGFPHRPDGAASISVMIVLPFKKVSESPASGNSLWHALCPTCGERFLEASRDPVVQQALVNLLGWYVRQAIDLKETVSGIREGL